MGQAANLKEARELFVALPCGQELIERITFIAYKNREYFPLFRGQAKERRTRRQTKLIASIYRGML